MGKATDPPVQQARSIFDDLGYDIAGDGHTFSATRDWKEITVRAVTGTPEPDSGSGYRCFVAWADEIESVRRGLAETDPGTEWALIGVDREGEYEVARLPSG